MADLSDTGRDRLLRLAGLVIGSIVFSFPFYWLLITSWKGERELFRFPPDLFPELPVSQQYSPYVHGKIYPKPRQALLDAGITDSVRESLEQPMWEKVIETFSTTDYEPWHRWSFVDPIMKRAVLNGIWANILPAIPDTVWNQSGEQWREAILEKMDGDRLLGVWAQARQEFLVGPMTVVTHEGVEERLEPKGPWVFSKSGMFETVPRKGIEYDRIRYDFGAAESIRFSRRFKGPALASEPMIWAMQFRYDLTQHRMHIDLEGADYRLAMDGAAWLDTGRYAEVSMHRPEIRGDVYDYNLIEAEGGAETIPPGEMLVTVTLTPSNALERLYGKFFRNYRMGLVAFPFDKFIWNSLYLVVLSIIGQLLSCSLIAYGFARLRWPGRDAVFLVLLATMMLPPQVTTIPVFLVFKSVGWYNTLKPIWVPAFFGAPFFVFLLRQFFLGIPRDLEEAAQIDGCGHFRTFATIMLPLIRPALAAIAIFQFMNTWNDFFGPLIYTNDMELAPLPLGLFIFRSSTMGQDYGMLMAATTVMTLPVIALFFFAQRYFIQGITLTGLKG